jgi:hypothetical protein
MDSWTPEKWFAVFGAVSQLAGFVVLARIDFKAWQAAKARENVRPDQLLEIYQSARDGVQYESSTQELEAAELELRASKASTRLKFGLGLACLGAIFQLLAALFGK